MAYDSEWRIEDIIAALRALEGQWETRAGEVQAAMQKLRVADPNRTYYRGLAEGYGAALKDLRALLYPAAGGETAAVDESFVPVSAERARALLERAGLAVSDLHAHKDNSFSAVFAPLQVLSVEERIAKLTSAGDVAILDTGRLPNSNKAYIDFAFRSLPEST